MNGIAHLIHMAELEVAPATLSIFPGSIEASIDTANAIKGEKSNAPTMSMLRGYILRIWSKNYGSRILSTGPYYSLWNLY